MPVAVWTSGDEVEELEVEEIVGEIEFDMSAAVYDDSDPDSSSAASFADRLARTASIDALVQHAKSTTAGGGPRLLELFQADHVSFLPEHERRRLVLAVLDVDGNGTIDVGDLADIRSAIGTDAPGAADINRDGVCDVMDIDYWLRWRNHEPDGPGPNEAEPSSEEPTDVTPADPNGSPDEGAPESS